MPPDPLAIETIMTDAVRIGIANGIELTFCSIMSSIIVFNLFARTFLLKPKVIIIQSIERGVRHILYAHDGASRIDILLVVMP